MTPSQLMAHMLDVHAVDYSGKPKKTETQSKGKKQCKESKYSAVKS